MNTKEPTIDEQIAKVRILVEAYEYGNVDAGVFSAILASLEELKRIEAVKVPVELRRFNLDSSGDTYCWPDGEYVSYHDYDTLLDLLRRKIDFGKEMTRLNQLEREQTKAAESKLAAVMKLGQEPSEEMADSVRGVLQMLRNNSGVTYEEIKTHCSMRGDDLSWWPKWADEGLPAYVTEQGAAILLFKAMFAKLLEQAGVGK